jgi:hypothetical protein
MASSADRFFNCPASVNLTDNMDKSYQYNAFKDVAKTGSQIHDAGEHGINYFLKGKKYTVNSLLKNAGIDKKHADYEKAKTAATKYINFFKARWKAVNKKPGKTKAYIEQKYRGNAADTDLVAKMDSMIIRKDKKDVFIDIYDLKTGNYDYSSSAINQIYFTGLLVIINLFKKEQNLIYNITPGVCQPNFTGGRNNVLMDTFILNHDEAEKELKLIINRVKESAEFTPGNYCKFCPALLVCPAIRNIMHIITQGAALDPAEISTEWLEFIWLNKKLIENYLENTTEIIKEKLQTGGGFNNITIGTAYGRRKWKDKKEVEKTLAYLGDKLFEPRKLKSPAQMEKLAGKQNITDLYETPEYPKVIEKEITGFDEV